MSDADQHILACIELLQLGDGPHSSVVVVAEAFGNVIERDGSA